MSNSDRWKELASLLGIQPAAASEPASPPVPSPPVEAPPRAESQPRPPKPPTDWSRLAGDLGLAPEVVAAAVSPPKPRPAKPVVPPPLPVAPPSQPQPIINREVRQSESSFPAPRAGETVLSELFVASTEFQSYEVRTIELVDDVSPEPHLADEEGDRPRRKSRRRGGRGRSRRGNREDGDRRDAPGSSPRSEQPLDAPSENVPWSSEGSFLEELDHVDAEDLQHPSVAGETQEADADDARPTRRRRRRRGRGRRDRTAETSQKAEIPGNAEESREELDSFDRPARPARPERQDRNRPSAGKREADPYDDLHHDEDHDALDDGHELDKSHRTVPSWDEAIGIIVTANLESRAHSPNSRPANRGRGRGRGRGGRRDNSR